MSIIEIDKVVSFVQNERNPFSVRKSFDLCDLQCQTILFLS